MVYTRAVVCCLAHNVTIHCNKDSYTCSGELLLSTLWILRYLDYFVCVYIYVLKNIVPLSFFDYVDIFSR